VSNDVRGRAQPAFTAYAIRDLRASPHLLSHPRISDQRSDTNPFRARQSMKPARTRSER
jgi:hypothetical protein